MGDTGESHTGNETASEARNLDSLKRDTYNKDAMPFRVAVDGRADSADPPPYHEATTPLRVAVHNDGDGDENMSEDEHEGEYEYEEEEEDEGTENPMEEPVVEDSDMLSSVRIVAHVTYGMADSDTGEQLAFPDEQYDEEEHGRGHQDDHDKTHEDGRGEIRGEVHCETNEENQEDYEEDREVDHYEDNGENRALVHGQDYADYHEEEQQQVQDEGEMSQQEDDHVMFHSEDRQDIDQQRKADELQALINLAEDVSEADKTEDEAKHISMNGGAHIGGKLQEQLVISDVKVTGERPMHHDESVLTKKFLSQAGHSSVKQHGKKGATPTKAAGATGTGKKKPRSTVPHVKSTRPSTALVPGARVHAQPEPDGSIRAKRVTQEEAEASDSASQPRGAANTRPSARASRAKLTVPQPFHLATERRASLGGRPADTDAPRPRTAILTGKKSQPAPVTKTNGTIPGGIRAAPTEISKEDQEALDTLEKDMEAKLEEEIAALRIKSGNPSGFSFKSDERAEKRREFYSKLEEKMKAKEEEKSQIQAKSQEELENKMKQLRKSLTFKATPLPSFYQETGPPKVEVKKIPPTRPKSPKLTTSRRGSLAGDQEGPKSPVAKIKSDSRASGLGLPNKSVDLTDDKKAPVRKSVTKIPSMEKSAIRPNANGDAKNGTAGKVKSVGVLPSPRKTSTAVVAESRTNRAEGQDQKADSGMSASANEGRSTNPRRSLHNGGPSTDRTKTGEVGKTRSGKSSGGVGKADSKDGVRKSMQWRPKTNGSTPKRESLEAEPVKLVINTPIKDDLTSLEAEPVKLVINTPIKDDLTSLEAEPVKLVIATRSREDLTPVVPDVAVV